MSWMLLAAWPVHFFPDPSQKEDRPQWLAGLVQSRSSGPVPAPTGYICSITKKGKVHPAGKPETQKLYINIRSYNAFEIL